MREVGEELGLVAEAADLIGVYSFRRMNQIIIAYHVLVSDAQIVIDESEIAAYKEIPIAKIRPWKAGTGYALRDFLATRGYFPDFI